MGFTMTPISFNIEKDYKSSEYVESTYLKYLAEQIYLKFDELFDGIATRDECTFTFPNLKNSFVLSYNINNITDSFLTIKLDFNTYNNWCCQMQLYMTNQKYDENISTTQLDALDTLYTIPSINFDITNTNSNFIQEDIGYRKMVSEFTFYFNMMRNSNTSLFNVNRTNSLINGSSAYVHLLGIYKDYIMYIDNDYDERTPSYIKLHGNDDSYKEIISIMCAHKGCNDDHIIYLPTYMTEGSEYYSARESEQVDGIIDLPLNIANIGDVLTINGKDYVMINRNFALEI